MAKTAEVASQIVSPGGRSAIQSPFGTRTPEVVPFQVKTTSSAGIDLRRDRAARRTAPRPARRCSFSCFDVGDPALAEASPRRGGRPARARAATTARSRSPRCPRPARCPTRQSAGTPRMRRAAVDHLAPLGLAGRGAVRAPGQASTAPPATTRSASHMCRTGNRIGAAAATMLRRRTPSTRRFNPFEPCPTNKAMWRDVSGQWLCCAAVGMHRPDYVASARRTIG